MRSISTLFMAVSIVIGLAWATTTDALANDLQCTGTVTGGIYENLEVPIGATCVLNGTRVDGNIFVRTGAALQASDIEVEGNIQAEGAAVVTVNNNSTVGGNIQLKQGGSSFLDQVIVEGDIQLESNSQPQSVTRNTVGGNIQIVQNTGGAAIFDNRIDGNLQCKQNNPAPTGGRNQAASFEDQCAGFQGTPQDMPPPPPSVVDGKCVGSVSGQMYENLEVPSGATCLLYGTHIKGNLTVKTGAILQANGVNVEGNIQAEGAATVAVMGNAIVGGSVQLIQGGNVALDQVTVTGDIQMESNRRELNVTRNTVGGNIQVTQNTGGVSISHNQANGDLQCSQNNPAPFGGANQAADLADQCAGFDSVTVNTPERVLLPGLYIVR